MRMKRLSKGFTLIELMIVVAVIGVLAAIAIPNFIRFQARSKQSEAKANLKAAYTAELAFVQEKDHFDPHVDIVGFSPERNNRYAYYLSASGALEPRTGTAVTPVVGSTGIDVDTFKSPGGSEPYVASPCAPTSGTTVPGV